MEDGVSYKVFLFLGKDSKPEIRRFTADRSIGSKIRPLKTKLSDLFPTLKTRAFTVAWKDEDGDEILMSSDEEIKTMLIESHDTVLKLIVRCTDDDDDEDDEKDGLDDLEVPITSTAAIEISDCLHQGISCDVCGRAITGYRYKCITCDKFDLCMRCENNGNHPDHCLIRVPIPNMSLPLLKASIKKSRRFLKSVASQVHEDKKRHRHERRERTKHASDANATNKGKDSKPRSWVEVFGKCIEQFTNLAGPVPRNPEPGTSTRTAPAEIIENIMGLPQEDHEKLVHAFRYLSDNVVSAGVEPLARVYDKVFEIAATFAEEASAQSQARATSPIREISARKFKRETSLPKQDPKPSDQSNSKAPKAKVAAKPHQEAPKVEPKTQQDAAKAVAKPEQDAPKFVQEAPKVAQEAAKPVQEASGLAPSTSESAKIPTQNDDIVKFTLGKDNISGNVSPDAAVANIYVNRSDISELVNAVFSAKSELSSNASSCSSEGQASEKADGWTVIDPSESPMKDDKSDNCPDNMQDLPKEIQERIRYRSPIYPDLNIATAKMNPKVAADATASASAPPLPKAQANAKVTSAKFVPGTVKAAPSDRIQLPAHIDAAVRSMEAMGFHNESGWLTQLLVHNDGNIAAVLDLITPNCPTARNTRK